MHTYPTVKPSSHLLSHAAICTLPVTSRKIKQQLGADLEGPCAREKVFIDIKRKKGSAMVFLVWIRKA
jgi:hypothetical protein